MRKPKNPLRARLGKKGPEVMAHDLSVAFAECGEEIYQARPTPPIERMSVVNVEFQDTPRLGALAIRWGSRTDIGAKYVTIFDATGSISTLHKVTFSEHVRGARDDRTASFETLQLDDEGEMSLQPVEGATEVSLIDLETATFLNPYIRAINLVTGLDANTGILQK